MGEAAGGAVAAVTHSAHARGHSWIGTGGTKSLEGTIVRV